MNNQREILFIAVTAIINMQLTNDIMFLRIIINVNLCKRKYVV